jgi:uncharacterized membrane protein YagU involved in acid resistance
MRRLVVNAGLSGLAGGVAMIPFGLLLRRVLGYSLNVYGELLVKTLLGSVPPWAMAVEHLLISVAMALPLVVLVGRTARRSPLLLGALYGAAVWLVVNSLLLPAAFGRPTPWRLGWSAIWPSLMVHVIYGTVAAMVAGRSSRPAASRA